MKLLTVFLFAAVLMIGSEAQMQQLCLFCSGFISIPTEWAGAQELLSHGCNTLGPAKDPCNGLVNAADLTSSYPNMHPYIVQLKELGCQKFCDGKFL